MRRETGLLMDGDEPAGGQVEFRPREPQARPARSVPAEAAALRPRPDDARRCSTSSRPASPNTFRPPAPVLVRHRRDGGRGGARRTSSPRPCRGSATTRTRCSTGEPFLYHAVLSLYLNAGLLDPLDVCRRAEAEYRAGRAPLNAVEGFIRQILGWREFVRGIYAGRARTTRRATTSARRAPLPGFYWTARHRHGLHAGGDRRRPSRRPTRTTSSG